MRKIDKDGLLLCEIQAQTFEKSLEYMDTSSEIFMRRFMKSKISKRMDDESLLDTNLQPADILELINEEYGVSNYGSVKYEPDEMYWIGYVYRYFSYTYEFSSSQVYKLVKPKELRSVYLPYHTMDPSQAIERILEAKNMFVDKEIEFKRQCDIFRKYRQK